MASALVVVAAVYYVSLSCVVCVAWAEWWRR
jgi:hypothetical protein